jgi:hypothetical protein
MSDSNGVPSAEPPADRHGRRYRRGIILVAGAVVVVLAIGITVTALLMRDGSPAGAHDGDCVKYLPQTIDGKFEKARVIPCDSTDARFRLVAVRSGLDDPSATQVCLQEQRRIGKKLLLMFNPEADGRGEAICVETL